MQPPLFDYLKDGTGDLWERAQEHPFVSALADASLERTKFIHYLKQDYAYLIGYSRALALATAKAPTLARMSELTALLNETLNTEMQLHRDFCAQFDITPDELAAVEPSPICQAYIDFCIATAATGDILDLLAALTPCGVGYAEIGARLIKHSALSPSHSYRQWIYTYGGEDYQQYARWMVTALNELGAETPESRLPRLTRLFCLGLRYEWLFWDMAWQLDDWPL